MKDTMKKQKGFTLVELMIAVVIIAIIASFGWSYFDAQARRGYRTEAIDALMRIAQLQERWHSRNGTYHGNVNVLFGNNITPAGRYNLQINLVDADTYTATATIVALATANNEDDDCAVFSINQAGAREAFDNLNNDATRNCWSQ